MARRHARRANIFCSARNSFQDVPFLLVNKADSLCFDSSVDKASMKRVMMLSARRPLTVTRPVSPAAQASQSPTRSLRQIVQLHTSGIRLPWAGESRGLSSEYSHSRSYSLAAAKSGGVLILSERCSPTEYAHLRAAYRQRSTVADQVVCLRLGFCLSTVSLDPPSRKRVCRSRS
jgi:hypothetical protein